MKLPNAARLAARVIHAVTAELAELNAAPAEPETTYREQSATAATTQVNTATPGRAYRDARVTTPYATGGAGFTGDPR